MPSDLAHSLSILMGVAPWEVEAAVEGLWEDSRDSYAKVEQMMTRLELAQEESEGWRERALAAEGKLERLRERGLDRDWNVERAREIAPANGRFRVAVRAALHRGKSWGLTEEEYLALAEQPCRDCGGPTGSAIGLDRLDEGRGYEPDNVEPCCGPCNMARHRSRLPKNVMARRADRDGYANGEG